MDKRITVGGNRGGAIKRLALAGGLLAGWACPAPGQVAVELRIPSPTVLLYESATASVTLQNNSGRIVMFDERSELARFWFEILQGEAKLIEPLSKAPLLSGVELAPGGRRTLEFNIPRLYALGNIGRYKVCAAVDCNGKTYASAPVYLEIVKGIEISRQQAGVPDDPRASRTYVLEYLQKDTGEESLYLRIEDEAAGEIYGVFNLGRVVRVRQPDLKVDAAGNVHILFQTRGTGYLHYVFTPYGTVLANESLPGGNRKVELTRQADGQVVVTGAAGREAPKEQKPESVKQDGPINEFQKSTGGLIGKMFR